MSTNIVINEKNSEQKEGKIIIEIPQEFSKEKLGALVYLKSENGKIRTIFKEIVVKTTN